MGFDDRLAQACVASNLQAVEEKIRPVEHVAALAGATSIGSDMFRARDYDLGALKRAILLLAKKVRAEMNLGSGPAQQLAGAAILEVMHWQCRTCNGASAQVVNRVRQVCPKCGGSGAHRWTDHERAKAAGYNEDTWQKWSAKYEKVIAMARRHDSGTVGLAHKKMG